MIAPSGEQVELVHGDQRAVVVEVGGGLREYTLGSRNLLDGYGANEMSSSGRGQVLIPWPNRIQDGRYSFDGQDHQLPLDDVEEQDAIHGLVRWGSWIAGDRAENRVVMEHALHPQPGYPFSLALSVEYLLSDDGLLVRTTATNRGPRPCPYGSGNHPYLMLGQHSVDPLTLRVPGAKVLVSDERGIPVGSTPVKGTDYDFREPRTIGATVLDHAFTDLERGDDGRARVELQDPEQRHRARALGRRNVSLRHGVHGRSASGCEPAQPRRRADDVSTERVSERRGAGPAGAGRVLHEQLGHRSAQGIRRHDRHRQRVLSRRRRRRRARGVPGRSGVDPPAVAGRRPRDHLRDTDRSRRAGLRRVRRVPQLLLEPRARHALLLRRLRDRLRKDPRPSPPACRPGLAVVARLGLFARRAAHADGPRAVAPVHGLGAGHHSHRHPDTGPERRWRAAHPLRHLSARRRRGGGVRPDPAHHAGVLDEGRSHERAHPRSPSSSSRLWRQ